MDTNALGQLVLWVNTAILAATVLIFFQVFLMRIVRYRARTTKERAAGKWQPLLARCVAGRTPVAVPRLLRRERREFVRLWNDFHDQIPGNAPVRRLRLNKFAEQVGLEDFAQRLIDQPGPESLLLGVMTLGNLRTRKAWPELEPILNHRDPLISLSAAHALAKISPARAAKLMLPLIVRRPDWPLPRLATVLLALGEPRVCSRLVTITRQAQATRQLLLLKLLYVVGCRSASTVVNQIMAASDDPEIIAAGLQLCNHRDNLGPIYDYLEHANWVIRMRAAESLGRIPGRSHLKRLTVLLSDPNWWVRYRAAQATVGVVDKDLDQLGTILVSLPDSFAADILAQAISEVGAQ